jgi:hypothetical protein
MSFYTVEIKNQHAVRDQVDLIMAEQGFIPKLGRDEDDFNHLTYDGESFLVRDEFASAIKSQLEVSLQHEVDVSIL